LHRIELGSERQEDVYSWNTPYPTGALLAERLGRLVGEELVAKLGAEYLKLPRPRTELPRFVAQRCALDLGWFFDQWLGPIRSMAVRIGAIRRLRTATGWRTEVDIQRVGDRIDVVDVKTSVKGGPPNRGSVLLDSPLKAYSFESSSKTGRVELDPQSQVDETWRADNLSPPRLKLLLYNSRVNLEPKSGQLDA